MDALAFTAPSLLAQQPGGALGGLVLPVLFIAIFYFLLIRPQQRRARQQRSLVSSLSPRDRVVTIGGLHGTIESIGDDTMRLEVAPGIVLTLQRGAVARKLNDAEPGDAEGRDGEPGAADRDETVE